MTINILAEDFKNNAYMNLESGLRGCPMERALFRRGKNWYDTFDAQKDFHKAHQRIDDMFSGREPIQDFSFELNL